MISRDLFVIFEEKEENEEDWEEPDENFVREQRKRVARNKRMELSPARQAVARQAIARHARRLHEEEKEEKAEEDTFEVYIRQHRSLWEKTETPEQKLIVARKETATALAERDFALEQLGKKDAVMLHYRKVSREVRDETIKTMWKEQRTIKQDLGNFRHDLHVANETIRSMQEHSATLATHNQMLRKALNQMLRAGNRSHQMLREVLNRAQQ